MSCVWEISSACYKSRQDERHFVKALLKLLNFSLQCLGRNKFNDDMLRIA